MIVLVKRNMGLKNPKHVEEYSTTLTDIFGSAITKEKEQSLLNYTKSWNWNDFVENERIKWDAFIFSSGHKRAEWNSAEESQWRWTNPHRPIKGARDVFSALRSVLPENSFQRHQLCVECDFRTGRQFTQTRGGKRESRKMIGWISLSDRK